MTITEKIRKYYSREDCKLEVLDDGKTYGEFGGEYFYAAVSLTYIHKHVLKEEHLIGNVARRLFQLCKEEFLLPIPCGWASDLVFCNKKYQDIRGGFAIFSTGEKKIEIEPKGYWFGNQKKDQSWIDHFNKYLHT